MRACRAQLLAMGFGFVEVGTLTPRAQSGNPRPACSAPLADRAIINRLGFNNEGQEAALARLKDRPRGIVGVNVGAGRDSEDRIADYVTGIERMAEVASYLTVNISSPNTPGLRDLQAPAALDALLKRVQAARSAARASRRSSSSSPPISPTPTCRKSSRVIIDHGVDGIIVSNTTLAREGLRDQAFARETGGLSGRPLFARSTRMLARVYQLTQGKLPLIGVGGIDSGEAALAKIEAGATLLQLYTGLVFEGPGLIGRIKRVLVEAMAKGGFATLAPLIGRRAGEWSETAGSA